MTRSRALTSTKRAARGSTTPNESRAEDFAKRRIAVGDTIRFGYSRRMVVTQVKEINGPHLAQVITLVGKRGGVATANVFRSGRIYLWR